MNKRDTFRAALLILFLLSFLSLGNAWCCHAAFNHSNDVAKIDYAPGNTLIATTSVVGNRVYVYDAVTYALLFTHTPSSGNVRTARFSKDGVYLGVGMSNGSILLLPGQSPFSSTPLFTVNTTGNVQIADIAFSTGLLKMLVCYTAGTAFRIFNPYSGTPVVISIPTVSSQNGCKFSSNDDMVIIGANSRAYIYLTNTTAISAFVSTANNIFDLDVRPSATPIKMIIAVDNNLGYNYFVSGGALTSSIFSTAPGDNPTAACYSKDAVYYTLAGDDTKVYIFA